MSFLNRALTWWNRQTLGTQIWTWRFGEKVGEDEQGNIYYQTKGGKRRWVIYKDQLEASLIPPGWNAWLHHTWDETPLERPPVRQTWEKPHLPNMTGTPLAYAPLGSLRRADVAQWTDYEPWHPEE